MGNSFPVLQVGFPGVWHRTGTESAFLNQWKNECMGKCVGCRCVERGRGAPSGQHSGDKGTEAGRSLAKAGASGGLQRRQRSHGGLGAFSLWTVETLNALDVAFVPQAAANLG